MSRLGRDSNIFDSLDDLKQALQPINIEIKVGFDDFWFSYLRFGEMRLNWKSEMRGYVSIPGASLGPHKTHGSCPIGTRRHRCRVMHTSRVKLCRHEDRGAEGRGVWGGVPLLVFSTRRGFGDWAVAAPEWSVSVLKRNSIHKLSSAKMDKLFDGCRKKSGFWFRSISAKICNFDFFNHNISKCHKMVYSTC